MKQYLIPDSGKFYKANMHMHTIISDGIMTAEETRKWFKDQGYSIVAFTDHEVMVPHNDLAEEDFLPITSYELAFNDEWPGGFQFENSYHLNLYAKNKETSVSSVFSMKNIWIGHSKEYVSEDCAKVQYRRHYSVEGVNDIIRKANAEGFLVCYNHPVWSGHRYPDYAGLKGLWGVEVYNGCNREGYLENTQAFDDLLHQNESVVPVAADDAHGPSGCGHGWIQIKAEKLEYDTVMEALEQGDFYASTGPEIHQLYIEDGVVHISASDAMEILLRTERRFAKVERGSEENPVKEAVFDIRQYVEDSEKNESLRYRPWFRLEVYDKRGKAAYTRAYYVDELMKA